MAFDPRVTPPRLPQGFDFAVYETVGGTATPASAERWAGVDFAVRGYALPVDSFEQLLAAIRQLHATAAQQRETVFYVPELVEANTRYGAGRVAPHFAFAPVNLKLPREYLDIIGRLGDPSAHR